MSPLLVVSYFLNIDGIVVKVMLEACSRSPLGPSKFTNTSVGTILQKRHYRLRWHLCPPRALFNFMPKCEYVAEQKNSITRNPGYANKNFWPTTHTTSGGTPFWFFLLLDAKKTNLHLPIVYQTVNAQFQSPDFRKNGPDFRQNGPDFPKNGKPNIGWSHNNSSLFKKKFFGMPQFSNSWTLLDKFDTNRDSTMWPTFWD